MQNTTTYICFYFILFSTYALSYCSSNDILVDDAVVRREDVVEIKCGTEMVLGPNREGQL